ncbi:MAG TPA: type II CAAX endopeptidase family protein [Pyrinomonadaceae bacterium]|nr:type II CAAX endopeptidase family protein [Pyrinomonadaceae bacterium]
MNLQNILFDQTGKIRSGLRLPFFLLVFIFIAAFASILIFGLMTAGGSKPEVASPTGFALNSLILLSAALTAGWFSGRLLEGLPFRALGASLSWIGLRNLAIGCGLGAATFVFAVIIGYFAGGLRFELNTQAATVTLLSSALIALGVFSVAAAFEEALFRGYILQSFARSGLAWLAILLTSAFFGIAHLSNPNLGFISTANTMLAGVWFGIAYLKTRDLWFVTGMHLMWNWMQGAVFGIEVSGLTELSPAPLLNEIDSGPTWLTGGDYGLEGGIACTAALIASLFVIHFLPIRPDDDLLAFTTPANQGPEPKVAP